MRFRLWLITFLGLGTSLLSENLRVGEAPYSNPSGQSLRYAVLDTGEDVPVKELNNRGDFVGEIKRWINGAYETLQGTNAAAQDLSEDGTVVGSMMESPEDLIDSGERAVLWPPHSTTPVVLQTPGVEINFPDGSRVSHAAAAYTIDGGSVFGKGDHIWWQVGNTVHGQEVYGYGEAGLSWDLSASWQTPAIQHDNRKVVGVTHHYDDFVQVLKARGGYTLEWWTWNSALAAQPPYWQSDQSFRIDKQRVPYRPWDINKYGAHTANTSPNSTPNSQPTGSDFLQHGDTRIPLPKGARSLNARRTLDTNNVLVDDFQVVGGSAASVFMAEPEFPGSTNYVTHNLSSLVPTNWTVNGAYDINDHGVIAASATKEGSTNPTTVLLIPMSVVPDWNRDGVIDKKDRGKVTSERPWRFWVNDNDDSGTLEGTDVPGSGGNGHDQQVNGIRDLVDWFPVFLDIKLMLEVLPASSHDYILEHEENALSLVETT